MRTRILAASVALLGATGIAVLAPGAAQAAPCSPTQICTTTFYQEAAHIHVVGKRMWSCGDYSEWGTTSPYNTYTVRPCL